MNVTTATDQTFKLHDVLRAIAGILETPVVAILILLILSALVLAGWLVAEFFTRRRLKINLSVLLDEIHAGKADLQRVLSESGLLKNQKALLLELTSHSGFSDTMREALAIRLLEEAQAGYDKILKLSDIIARLGPIFGLLGTLIPLGPGIIALGQGDTFTLAASLLTAFDTTVTGLLAAAIAMIISAIRGAWYKDYMSMLEALASGVLETLKEKDDSA